MLAECLRAFARAGLGIKVLGAPIVPANRAIFQLDIHRANTGTEYFRVWPGAVDVAFDPLDVHRGFRQLLLRVHEPRRRFEELLMRNPWRDDPKAAEQYAASVGGRVDRVTGRGWIIERWTSSAERRYLCGFDESCLFIAQIRGGETVADAHESLKPGEVIESPLGVVRQGEWFFLPVDAVESKGVDRFAAAWRRSARRDEPLGEGGQPHVADEVVRVDRRTKHGNRERRRLDLYARGRVRHRDHREIVLEGWRRVVRNRAIAPMEPDRQRMRWID